MFQAQVKLHYSRIINLLPLATEQATRRLYASQLSATLQNTILSKTSDLSFFLVRQLHGVPLRSGKASTQSRLGIHLFQLPVINLTENFGHVENTCSTQLHIVTSRCTEMLRLRDNTVTFKAKSYIWRERFVSRHERNPVYEFMSTSNGYLHEYLPNIFAFKSYASIYIWQIGQTGYVLLSKNKCAPVIFILLRLYSYFIIILANLLMIIYFIFHINFSQSFFAQYKKSRTYQFLYKHV